MARRVFCAILAFCLLFLFCACDSQGIPVSTEVLQSVVPKDVSGLTFLDQLEGYDFGGREFRIAVYQSGSIFPQNTETPLDLALQKRNAMVEKKYNVKLKNAGIRQETFFEDIQTAYEAGEDVCDIIVAPRGMLPSFLAGDMLLNVNSLPHTNYSKTYYDRSAMAAASMGAVTYEIAGDFVYSPGSYWCVVYNIPLMEWFATGLDFVDLARNDQWTWDLFNRYVYLFDKDSNGDRVMTDEDLFGVTSSASDETLMQILWSSAGIPFFENNPPEAMQMDYDSEDALKMMETVRTTMDLPGRYTQTGDSKTPLQLFLDDQSLFYICPASTVGYLQSQGMNIGMLPMPKLTPEQEHFYGFVDESAPVVYVLNNCRDTEFVGRIVQALFAASDGIMYEHSVDTYSTYYLTGNAALNCFIDLIKHGYYDPSNTLAKAFPEVGAASVGILYDMVFLKGDFRALYDHQVLAFNETYAQNSIHSAMKEESE